ncbi:Rieske 2Fe-2S domain-containing protein [Streptomyces sp. NBC_01171]|uniref:Rieske 2Fe-2S domain-containing protein n=1 Tax=Streptomyces sp. NBC_01171 TaxID=2903757 RepID=UPI00386F9E29|nr:Rieske 2Fe-2S domain-containing protein [Streptomyces sp. NBC_01171]
MPKQIEHVIQDIEGRSALDALTGPVAELVNKVTQPTAVKNALSGTWLGHALHPVLTDVPIGAWGMATVLDLTAGERGARAARKLVGFGLLAVVPTAASGASDWADTIGGPQRVGLVHGMLNSAATVLQAASWVARLTGRRRAGVVLSGVGLGLTGASAYLGGHLSYVNGVGVNHTAFEEPTGKWTDVAALTALEEDKPLRVDAGGVPVVLVRHGATVNALSATCTHAGGPLDEGKVDADGCLHCPWHGSAFRLADGEVTRGPATVPQPDWDVKISQERVLVRAANA